MLESSNIFSSIDSNKSSINIDDKKQNNDISYNELVELFNTLHDNYDELKDYNINLLNNIDKISTENNLLKTENQKLKNEIFELRNKYSKFEENKGKGRKEKKLKYDVVQLREQGFSYREIARMLNVSVSTVYSRVKKNKK